MQPIYFYHESLRGKMFTFNSGKMRNYFSFVLCLPFSFVSFRFPMHYFALCRCFHFPFRSFQLSECAHLHHRIHLHLSGSKVIKRVWTRCHTQHLIQRLNFRAMFRSMATFFRSFVVLIAVHDHYMLSTLFWCSKDELLLVRAHETSDYFPTKNVSRDKLLVFWKNKVFIVICRHDDSTFQFCFTSFYEFDRNTSFLSLDYAYAIIEWKVEKNGKQLISTSAFNQKKLARSQTKCVKSMWWWLISRKWQYFRLKCVAKMGSLDISSVLLLATWP